MGPKPGQDGRACVGPFPESSGARTMAAFRPGHGLLRVAHVLPTLNGKDGGGGVFVPPPSGLHPGHAADETAAKAAHTSTTGMKIRCTLSCNPLKVYLPDCGDVPVRVLPSEDMGMAATNYGELLRNCTRKQVVKVAGEELIKAGIS